MRISLNTTYTKIQTNLDQIATAMDRINERISTGLEMSKISDDPVKLVSALRFRTSIAELDQFTENIQYGETIINASEAALTGLKDMAIRAKTLAIQATDPALTTSNREAIAAEIKNLLDQAIQLGNTQLNGKYIFGGQRTTGYTDTEPAPFTLDQGDGHWVNGATMAPLDRYLTGAPIATAATSADLGDNDLFINGQHIGQVDLTTGADVNGVNMVGANNLKTQININSGLYSIDAATADVTGSTFQFNLNAVPITVNTAAGDTATDVANKTIAAINVESINTGVSAFLGNGTNGGPTDSVVFQNVLAGDPTAIEVTDFNIALNGGSTLGFTNFSKPTEYFTASLTTQGAGVAPTDLLAGSMDFSINGVNLRYSLTVAATAAERAQQHVDAINQASSLTGVTALLGTGTNGGPADSVILQNTEEGDETDIILANITPGPGVGTEGALSGLADGTYTVGAGNNTGQVSLASDSIISITTSATDDTILDLIGLGGGSVGNYDDAADGLLSYGYPLNEDDLKINGTAVPATTADSYSTIFAEASAAAKAAAINQITSQTGVTANIIPIDMKSATAVKAGTEATRLTGTVSNTEILANSLAINGTSLTTEISAGTGAFIPSLTGGLNMQKAFNAVTQINTLTSTTNVTARLTTLYAGAAVTPGLATPVSFSINGVTVSTSTGGISITDTATDVINAINAVSDQSGVEATLGTGTNGGPYNGIILNNIIRGNEQDIVISGIDAGPPPVGTPDETFFGLANGTHQVSNTTNTGEISFESKQPFSITSPTTSPDADIILNELGLSSVTAVGVGVGSTLTGTVNGAGIGIGELAVNGTPITGAIGGVPTVGINMAMASAAKTQIELADPNVSANLTTMTTSGVAATAPAVDTDISFSLNGELVNITYLTGSPPNVVANAAVAAINQLSPQTGVEAFVGDGATNGAPLNALVFRNKTPGDDSAIIVSGVVASAGVNTTGITNFYQEADASNNSGQITISSSETFDLSSPTVADDSILSQLGMGGGSVGFSDIAADGIVYGTLGTGTGSINSGATPAYLDTGDLVINDVEIFSTPTAILQNDSSMALMDAINAKTSQTGIQATRGMDGKMILTAIDGRNMHIQTSLFGENVTHLNGGSLDQVFFGSLQLSSDRKFSLETELGTTSLTPNEMGLDAIGMAGGSSVTGESGDIAGDGKIEVFSIHDQIGTVRYNGDRENGLEVKIGKTSTMVVGENGEDGFAATTIFTTLKSLEDFLNNKNFTTVTGIHTATDTGQLLNSRETGLEPESLLPEENLFTNGSFVLTVTDKDYYPARTSELTVDVNTATDTLESIAKKIDGMANVSASWTADGQLKIESNDPNRYTINLASDTSNFLNATGVANEFMQSEALTASLDTLDSLLENLTEQISDFGARSNRIQIQSSVYDNMQIATKENLSIAQDTDMIKAVMDLKAKEVAYQAALSAAAKTMQLSLVDFL